jgi:hypothetical protein
MRLSSAPVITERMVMRPCWELEESCVGEGDGVVKVGGMIRWLAVGLSLWDRVWPVASAVLALYGTDDVGGKMTQHPEPYKPG